MLYFLLAQAATPTPTDPLSGGGGWIGAGLLGAVLLWLLLKHLPDKDRQINEMIRASADERIATIKRYDDERVTERASRHERANQFQKIITDMANSYEKAMKEFQTQHRTDAKEDRDAFLIRNDHLLDAIRGQTAELKVVLNEVLRGLCRWTKNDKE